MATDVRLTLPWMGAGTEFVVQMVDALPDDALRAPSALPGWSRAHVVAHLARNAEALARLATWARTGVETPMYADASQRDADIQSSATAPADTLRRELASTADELDGALAVLDADTWEAPVRTAQGRTVPAAQVPWMRVREVWLHAVDLGSGAGMDDLPPDVVDALLDDVTATLTGRDGCPPALLDPTDRARAWTLGSPADDDRLRGPAADLLGWVTGRGDGTTLTGTRPDLPAWL